MKSRLLIVLLALAILMSNSYANADRVAWAQSNAPTVTVLFDNKSQYPNNQVPMYEKFEATVGVTTVASNLQMPFDATPPAGVLAGIGVSVNGVFTSPTNRTHTQPAFYYQEFDEQIKNGRQWFYPTNRYSWRVRFAPDETGNWQYRITVQDANGSATSATLYFTVVSSTNNGFVRVSPADARYFEFTNGMYAPLLGYNMNYNHIDWTNPVLSNEQIFQKMSQNGIQLARLWLSQWSIWGSAWNPWYGIRNDYDGYIPRSGLCTLCLDPAQTVMVLGYNPNNSGNYYDACRFTGAFQPALAVQRNTNYRIKIHYNGFDIAGPRDSTFANYGLVGKIQNPNDGNWHRQCYNGDDPQNGVRVTAYGHNTNGWAWLEGDWYSGSSDFMPLFYLAAENVNPSPWIAIDRVEIIDPDGVNIISKPSMDYLAYFGQRNSYAFDQVVDLAHQYGIYLRPVIMDKNEQIENEIGYDGTHSSFTNNNFYGNYRTMTAVRWYQQAWWRYLQARWGYSTNIQSWELLNEGDPNNTRHFTLADEFAKYMHQFAPNHHLASTSTWSIATASSFWGNSNYPNVDFMDIHQYISKDTNSTEFYDTALSTYNPSMWYGAKQSGGAKKPTIRGETGLTNSGTEPATNDVLADTQGIWLHNFIWGGINSGGMLESYWYENMHIYSSAFDHRNEYGNYYKFIKDVPLNNGFYQDIGATASSASLRVWGQKDTSHTQAHFWIQNTNHSWKNIVDRASIPAIVGNVTIPGFAPNKPYTIQWWNTYTGVVANSQSVESDRQGRIVLQINNLATDVAGKISGATTTISLFLPLIKK